MGKEGTKYLTCLEEVLIFGHFDVSLSPTLRFLFVLLGSLAAILLVLVLSLVLLFLLILLPFAALLVASLFLILLLLLVLQQTSSSHIIQHFLSLHSLAHSTLLHRDHEFAERLNRTVVKLMDELN
jgi:hypothetical protein